MLLLSEEDVRRLLPMREAIRLTREAFLGLSSGDSLNQPRRRLSLPTGSTLHSMAGAHGAYFGTKIYTTHRQHGATFLFLLCDGATARPLALFAANFLGQIRTGAATGVATDFMARPHADTVGLIGSGFQARSQLEAVLAVREIREVRLWSRNEDRRSSFARECGAAFGVAVNAVDMAREAVDGAAVVITATYAANPVLEAEWISPGTHVNAVGSNQPKRRELPADLIRTADLIAVDSLEQALIESGDLLMAVDPAEWTDLPLIELSALIANGKWRREEAQRTVFKSNGLGVEDVAAAGFVYERALESGAGRQVEWPYS